jgi:hypothetical protein
MLSYVHVVVDSVVTIIAFQTNVHVELVGQMVFVVVGVVRISLATYYTGGFGIVQVLKSVVPWIKIF